MSPKIVNNRRVANVFEFFLKIVLLYCNYYNFLHTIYDNCVSKLTFVLNAIPIFNITCFPNIISNILLMQFVDLWLVLLLFIHRFVCHCQESYNVQFPVKIHWATNNNYAIVVDQPEPQLILGINSLHFLKQRKTQLPLHSTIHYSTRRMCTNFS